jgi:hypothetical protein
MLVVRWLVADDGVDYLQQVIKASWLETDSGGEQTDAFVAGLTKSTNVEGLLQRLTCLGQLRPVLEEVTFRFSRVQLLLVDLAQAERLSPLLRVERHVNARNLPDCSLRLVFSLLDRGAKFALNFHDLHFGFPNAEICWTLTPCFGLVDEARIIQLVTTHTTRPSHGLLSRLSHSLLCM